MNKFITITKYFKVQFYKSVVINAFIAFSNLKLFLFPILTF